MKPRFLLPAILLVGLVAMLAVGLKLDPREVPSPLIGKPVPAFDLPTLAGEPPRFSQNDLRGRVTLVNFWASWCAGCRVEHPLLMELVRAGEIDLVGFNYKDTPAAARQWLTRYGDPYRISIVDEQGTAGLDWGVYGVPETFVVDGNGVILYKQIGPLTREDWEQHVRPLLRARA